MSTYATEPAALRADLNAEPKAVFDYAPPGLGKAERLVSLDALRGFDMFWILGADAVIEALGKVNKSPLVNRIVEQGDHVSWEGFHFYDLIFPLFVFIVGVSLVFSLSRTMEQFGRGEALRRGFRRSALLFLIALIYFRGFTNYWPDIRLLGVLNRLSLC